MPRKKATPLPGLNAWARRASLAETAYGTKLGVSLIGDSRLVLQRASDKGLRGRVQLVFTSPPFPLNRKKKYGNREGQSFKRWLADFATLLKEVLREDGSIVLEMGNAWEPGIPVMSTLAIETLLAFKKAADLYLCQEFVWYNPAKLPTPAQWVTVDRIRVKDAFTRLWWLSPSPRPKADNRRVLVPYSSSMRTLLSKRKYNSGRRPSEHVIGGTSFLTDNGGAIPPNVVHFGEPDAENVLAGSNTGSADDYQRYCRLHGLEPHPARMPVGLPRFFISLCTEPGDIVLDPFAGSNTTGWAAEQMRRRWVSVEAERTYAESGLGRFPALGRSPARR